MNPDPTIAVLLENLDRAFDATSWHGPNLRNALRGVDAQTARRAPPGRKTIWQQALHAAYWKQRVLNRVAGTRAFPRRGSNWPDPPATPTAAAWRADLALLEAIHVELRDAVARLDPAALTPKLRLMILGAAAHDLYHAGQIAWLKRGLRR